MSERLEFKGDYMGFTYNGTHSSELGIVRTSSGSRFNENLLPTMQDKTVPVPGGDGTYYFGSYYTQRQFSVSFAFDDLTEEQIAMLRTHFGDKGIHDLIFDERPYKVYRAKATGTATLKYIPFAEGNTNRLYKGEGTIQFTCYEPFARFPLSNLEIKEVWDSLISNNKVEEFKEKIREVFDNIDEWYDVLDRMANFGPNSNFGDVPIPFKLAISGKDKDKSFEYGAINWEKMPEDKSGVLDTKIGLVLDSDGNILNKYVSGDLTAKLPVGAEDIGSYNLDFTCLFI